jgi:hypothetical protein
MSQEVAVDFGKVDAATESAYLAPGMYRLKVDIDGLKVVAPDGKTAYLSVKFVDQNGNGVNEKFFLTAKAMPRLQYLHEAWFSKKLDKTFTSFVQVGEYFAYALAQKPITKPMVVGGKVTPDGKFFSGLPYSGFVIVDEKDFEEGAFEKGSDQYNKVVQIQKPNPAVANTDAAMLPEAQAGGYKPVEIAGGNPWD